MRLKLPLVLLVTGVGLLTLGLLLRVASEPVSVMDPAASSPSWLLFLGSAGLVLGLIGLARSRPGLA